MARVYLGLGSNTNPSENLRLAIRELRSRYGSLRQSAIYQSAALGFEGADFLNMVVGFESDIHPCDMQSHAEIIHALTGRDRSLGKFTSRPLDIDLLIYGDLVVDEPKLKLPRRDVLEYSFVLRPLAELEPGLVHPVTGKTIREHWREFDAASHPLRAVDVIL